MSFPNQTDFLEIVRKLTNFWASRGCIIVNPYDMQMGAATFHPATIMSIINDKPSRIAFMQPCRRPQDGRAGESGNRLYKHHQFQVIMMPCPEEIQQMVVRSLYECGIDPDRNNIDFVENNWNGPSLGAAGKGYEVLVNGNEVLQFTYFQQMAGCDLAIIPVEIAYGIERLTMMAQEASHFYQMRWSHNAERNVTYGEINSQLELDSSKAVYRSETLKELFKNYGTLVQELSKQDYMIPTYEAFMHMSHTFNLIENCGELSVSERVQLLSKVRHSGTLAVLKHIKNRGKDKERDKEIYKYKTTSYSLLNEVKVYLQADAHAIMSDTTNHELFIEIMTEKLPPIRNLKSLLSASLNAELRRYTNIKSPAIEIEFSCNRIVIIIREFPNRLAKEEQRIKGPRATVSEEVVDKFLSKHKRERSSLRTEIVDGEEFYFIEVGISIYEIREALSDVIHNSLANMDCPEYMRWTNELSWVRPIRRIVIMYNEEFIITDLPWIRTASSSLYTLIESEELIYSSSSAYFNLLQERNIYVQTNARRTFIEAQVNALLSKEDLVLKSDGESVMQYILLSCESPIIYITSYVDEFVIPSEIRQIVMVHHQKYIPLYHQDGTLSKKFMLHASYGLTDEGKKLKKDAADILRLRFQEAEYFWKKDMETPYEEHIRMLERTSLYDGLGSLKNQSYRLELIVDKYFGNLDGIKIAAGHLNLDLSMHSVFEIPELHGIMSGMYSVRNCGQDPSIQKIINGALYPKSDAPLSNNIDYRGMILGFCVRLDQLVGYLGIHKPPCGSSDPLGIRKTAASLVRLGYFLTDLPDLVDMIDYIIDLYSQQQLKLDPNTNSSVMDFIQKRAIMLLSQSYPKLSPAFVRPGILDWKEDQRLKVFALNNSKNESMLKTYKRLTGICKDVVFRNHVDIKTNEKYMYELVAFSKLDRVPDYNELLDMHQRIDSLLDNVHLNSLKENEKEYILCILARVKLKFDNYCSFGLID